MYEPIRTNLKQEKKARRSALAPYPPPWYKTPQPPLPTTRVRQDALASTQPPYLVPGE